MVELDECSQHSRTSLTLLAKLASFPPDELAWQQFLARYRPRIESVCLRRGLQQADAQDVSQNIMLRLTKVMRGFNYDHEGRFRSWLRRVTDNAITDYQQHLQKRATRSLTWDALLSQDIKAEFIAGLDETWEMELLLAARQAVSLIVTPSQWGIFSALVDEEKPAAVVAQWAGVTISNVYAIKSRIQRLLREEINRLKADGR